MKFGLDDSKTMINHWMLNHPHDIIERMRETELWKNEKTFEAKVFVNGIEMDFAVVEEYLQYVYESRRRELEDEFADQAEAIRKKAEATVAESYAHVMESIQNLSNAIGEAEDHLIRPYWDRPVRSRPLKWIKNENDNLDCHMIDSIYGMFQIVFEDDNTVSMVKCGEDTYTNYATFEEATNVAQETINGLFAANAIF